MTEASRLIDEKIASLDDWRAGTMRSVRALVLGVDPAIVEEWKWMGTAVWNRDGIICLANPHKNWVKVTFPKGAKLPDPKRVFNAELAGNAWRAIDLKEGDAINAEGFKGLVRAAIALNGSKPAKRKPTAKASVTAKTKKKPAAKKPVAKRR